MDNSSDPSTLPPCRVCGYPSKGIHYGANTCGSCKAFFNRSLHRHKVYECRSKGNTKGNCKFVPRTRGSCQYCRFQRCLQAGMSVEAIKSNRYCTLKRHTKSEEMENLMQEFMGNSLSGAVSETESLGKEGSPASRENTVHVVSKGKKDQPSPENTLLPEQSFDCVQPHFDVCFSQMMFNSDSNSQGGNFQPSPTGQTMTSASSSTSSQKSMMDQSLSSPSSGVNYQKSPANCNTAQPSWSSSNSQTSPGGRAQSPLTLIVSFMLQENPNSGHADQDKVMEDEMAPQQNTTGLEDRLEKNSCSSHQVDDITAFGLVPSKGTHDSHVPTRLPTEDFVTTFSDFMEMGPARLEETSLTDEMTGGLERFARPDRCGETDESYPSAHRICSPADLSRFVPEEATRGYATATGFSVLDPLASTGWRSREHQRPTELKSHDRQRPTYLKSHDHATLELTSHDHLAPTGLMSRDREAPKEMTSLNPLAATGLSTRDRLAFMYSDMDAVIQNLAAADIEHFGDDTKICKEEIYQQHLEHIEVCRLRTSTFGPLPLLSNDEYDALYAETGIDGDNRNNLANKFFRHMENLFRATIRFARYIPGFLSLQASEQVELIKWSSASIHILTTYPYYDINNTGVGSGPYGAWVCQNEMTGRSRQIFAKVCGLWSKLKNINLPREVVAIMKAMMIVTTEYEQRIDSPLADAIYDQLYKLLEHACKRNATNDDDGQNEEKNNSSNDNNNNNNSSSSDNNSHSISSEDLVFQRLADLHEAHMTGIMWMILFRSHRVVRYKDVMKEDPVYMALFSNVLDEDDSDRLAESVNKELVLRKLDSHEYNVMDLIMMLRSHHC